MTNLHPAIGQTFSTPFETRCVALTEPDELGNFDGIDSDGVTCEYHVSMVTSLSIIAKR